MAATHKQQPPVLPLLTKETLKALERYIGKNVGGYSTGTNTGTITATDRGNLKAIGAYVT